MADIRVDISTVHTNIWALTRLFDQLETGVQGITAAQGLQTTTTWTTIPACAQFAGTYGQSLAVLQERLDLTWAKIRRQAEALRDAATALAATDEATQTDLARMQASLDALIARAEHGPAPVAPRTSGPMRAI